MQPCIENAAQVLEIKSGKREASTPMTTPVEESPELDAPGIKEFLTALGMLGWLATTTRMDVAYAYSRIAQHSAKPTVNALRAVRRVHQYLLDTKGWCLVGHTGANSRDCGSVVDNMQKLGLEDQWRFYTDSDHAGNAEDQNRRRNQNGLVVTLNGAPVKWVSKATSVTFASPKIGEAHADMSSATAEIYAAGNGTLDIMALSYVVEEIGMEFPWPFKLEMDNDACRIFCLASAQKTKLKHIDCRQEWVRTLRDRSPCTCQRLTIWQTS